MRNLSLSAGLMLVVLGSAYAQTSNNQGNGQGTMQSTPTIQRQVQSNLEHAGFTDIKIMPESFLVRAKDKSGNPMMMVINPDSMAAVTELRSGTSGGTTGSASGRNPSGPANGNMPSSPGQNQLGAPDDQ
jgi:hypothetical protein